MRLPRRLVCHRRSAFPVSPLPHFKEAARRKIRRNQKKVVRSEPPGAGTGDSMLRAMQIQKQAVLRSLQNQDNEKPRNIHSQNHPRCFCPLDFSRLRRFGRFWRFKQRGKPHRRIHLHALQNAVYCRVVRESRGQGLWKGAQSRRRRREVDRHQRQRHLPRSSQSESHRQNPRKP